MTRTPYSLTNVVLRHLSNDDLEDLRRHAFTLTRGYCCDLELAVLFEFSRRRGLQISGHYTHDIDQRHKWHRYTTDKKLQTRALSA